jgi:hypothetical protein
MNKSYKTPTIPFSQQEVNPARALVHNSQTGILVLLLLHIPLALAMHASPLLATAHALITLAVGLSLSLFEKDLLKVSFAAAYITGAEVLWRMTEARIFWEAGKYFIIFILGIALLRLRPWRNANLPLLYLFFLLVSVPLTLTEFGLSSAARDALSFNLSGPLALAVSALYFLQMTFDLDSMRRLVWYLILPVLSLATLTLTGTIAAAGTIVFTSESIFATSGGFGPNQVSAILGLGGGLTFLLFLVGENGFLRWVSLLIALGFLALSALTFSRGGLYNAGVMSAFALIHLIRNKRERTVVIFGLLAIWLIGIYLIFPRLNAFTGGMLEQRFANLDTTNREAIARADLDVWLGNPILGVGPGLSKSARMELIGFSVAAHTEYTRVLAEHGVAGVLALVFLLTAIGRAYWYAPDVPTRVWMIALASWALVEMSHAAMRIGVISFLLGLSLVVWESPDRKGKP